MNLLFIFGFLEHNDVMCTKLSILRRQNKLSIFTYIIQNSDWFPLNIYNSKSFLYEETNFFDFNENISERKIN